MARTATKPKAAAPRKKAKAAARPTAARAQKTAPKRRAKPPLKSAVEAVEKGLDAATPDLGATKVTRKVASKAARRAALRLVRTAVRAGGQLARTTTSTALSAGAERLRKRARELPIQCSIDIGAPLEVAWDEWMTLTYLPEGAHRVEDIERDGDHLFGHVNGHEWSAEIVDERVDESFAWRSLDGSDCAGLVTFHRLSDRLTRMELDLDVIPVRVPEAVSLGLRLADRRAEADVRRFKARVEFLDPDAYERTPQEEAGEPDEEEQAGSEGE
ncbi:MAG: hypothetical protein QOH62_3210 [Solirubrobacteraceae bacterium]|jgi:uncharacterized membrane protein|nr:hypothetical protein [Solirubrobacteraceae bacterium]